MAVTIPLNKPYCTLLQLQKELKNTDADDEDTIKDWHHDCINRASRLIDEYCQRDFWYHDNTADGEGVFEVPKQYVCGQYIFMPWPVITINEIMHDDEEWDVEDFRANVGETRITYWTDIAFVEFEDNDWLTIDGTFGYTITDSEQPPTDAKFPEAIRRACIHIAAALTGDMRKEVQALDGSKVSLLDTRIPEEAAQMLKRYKRRFW
jgi:hypothetical protein